jgi:hypothetical protein
MTAEAVLHAYFKTGQQQQQQQDQWKVGAECMCHRVAPQCLRFNKIVILLNHSHGEVVSDKRESAVLRRLFVQRFGG